MHAKKLLVTTALALVALFALTGVASAYSAAVSPAGEISSPSEGKVSFTSGEITIRCNLTLTGELAETVELTSGSSMGEVSSVEWANCENGNVRAVLGLPWNLSVSATLGTLPDSGTGLQFSVDGASFQLSVFGGFVNCLYRGNALALLATNDTGTNTYSTGNITSSANALAKVSGALCPESGTLSGTFRLSPQQSLTVS